jgi:hypothetical protein
MRKRDDFLQQIKTYPTGPHSDLLDATAYTVAHLTRFSNQGKVSRWISRAYWRGGWRARLADLLVKVGNRWPGLLP